MQRTSPLEFLTQVLKPTVQSSRAAPLSRMPVRLTCSSARLNTDDGSPRHVVGKTTIVSRGVILPNYRPNLSYRGVGRLARPSRVPS